MIQNNARFKESLVRVLVHDEGLRLAPYKDSLGFWTIGVGRYIGAKLESVKISRPVAFQMLEEDIQEAWDDTLSIFSREEVNRWNDARLIAIVSMLFNLGRSRFSLFKNTIVEIKSERWAEAAANLRKSLWARQVRRRANRLIFMLETGELHETYKTLPSVNI